MPVGEEFLENHEDIVKTIQLNNSEITLVGTAHVSQLSVEMVEEKISTGDYDCIAVELCAPRLENITNQAWWKNLDIYQVFKKKKAGLLLINLALTAYQKRLAERIGVEAGKEMLRAVELAREKGLRLEVIDRNISTTLHRLVTEVSFWQKFKIVGGLIAGVFVGEEISEDQIEDLKRGDMLHAVVSEFGEELPEIKRVLIDERDEYMVGRLAQISEAFHAPKKILALVGAGHLQGMMPNLQSPPDAQHLEELDKKPPPGKLGLYIGWGICALILSMFVVGFMKSPELGGQLVVTWVLLNGGLCALGTALALGHPVSIIAAFFAAPLTSLNPTIGAGMVVGLVESYMRKPKVSDFESLREDISQYSMWWKNRVARLLLIFFFSSFGSMIGTYAAGASIVTQLLK
ncbi:MAG: TraB/GumN family protein [Nitrospina sp.]|jgi:pheromone shutdown-related protein TraB|nr:TraB/GumN family protein [Nitrospina sp.]MBT6718011.1 TraB/GumN family protein [Nitrospina sp.]